ncbi:hypothetical protein E2C01_044693 [Portunus trituberculatus]|uniref:Uncharacterized protein n=1 Tax=Portunus trituberculatus TaxID=210409 RepID=A0A5B7G013_PORTR|nr:hypothetical protein [Portunus trituberculatus]
MRVRRPLFASGDVFSLVFLLQELEAGASVRPRGPELSPLPLQGGAGHQGAVAGTAVAPAPGSLHLMVRQ